MALSLQARAQAYSVEVADPCHAYTWRVWENVTLPDGKILIPGVIAHTTAVVEHSETVAERIMNFAKLVGRERVIAGCATGSSVLTCMPYGLQGLHRLPYPAMLGGHRRAGRGTASLVSCRYAAAPGGDSRRGPAPPGGHHRDSLPSQQYTLAGRFAEAITLLMQAIEQTTASAMAGFQALYCLPLGEARLLAGRFEKALARAHQERGNEAYALRLLGEIAANREPPEGPLAEGYYRQALTLAKSLGMRPVMGHCHLGRAKLSLKLGHRERARAELSAATDLYLAMDMRFWQS